MEIWDAYRPDGSLAGCDLVRGEPIPNGLCHAVGEVLVQHVDGSYLLMRRDFAKQGYPGLYEATAGGSILKGVTPIAGALRELEEETGIKAHELTRLYSVLNDRRDTIYYGYLCVTACDKSSISLQEGETIGYLWLSKDAFVAFLNTDQYIQEHRDRLSPYLDGIV